MSNGEDPPTGGDRQPPKVPGGATASEKVLGLADHAVELLDVKQFIRTHLDSIYLRLEESDAYAQSAPLHNDTVFMALSLPIASGVIHIASDRAELDEARRWVFEKWPGPHPDPITILATLTLIYIAESGWRKYENNPEKRDQWQRIVGRVVRSVNDPASSAAANPRAGPAPAQPNR